jgi:hypothetical protein
MSRGVKSAGIFLAALEPSLSEERYLLSSLVGQTGGRAFTAFNALDTFFFALDIFFSQHEGT